MTICYYCGLLHFKLLCEKCKKDNKQDKKKEDLQMLHLLNIKVEKLICDRNNPIFHRFVGYMQKRKWRKDRTGIWLDTESNRYYDVSTITTDNIVNCMVETMRRGHIQYLEHNDTKLLFQYINHLENNDWKFNERRLWLNVENNKIYDVICITMDDVKENLVEYSKVRWGQRVKRKIEF
jgi:hypothetical protein